MAEIYSILHSFFILLRTSYIKIKTIFFRRLLEKNGGGCNLFYFPIGWNL